MSWQPLQVRAGEAPPDPVDGVPAWLTHPLWDWPSPRLSPDSLPAVAVALRVDVGPAGTELDILLDPKADPRRTRLLAACTADPDVFLNALDWALAHRPEGETTRSHNLAADRLSALFESSGSAWTVAVGRDGLVRRVTPAASRSLTSAKKAAKSATADADVHLNAAWTAAYGRQPDPSKAVSAAIQAVEAAAAPVVSPKDTKATLGKVLAELRGNQAGRWRLPLAEQTGEDPASTLRRLMALLWEGQGDRHGGVNPAVPPTQQEAEQAVHIAVLLVQLLAAGSVTRA